MKTTASGWWGTIGNRIKRLFAAGSGRGKRPPSSSNLRVGLALSSGGAKGLAHIGVIQVLEENGIPIDVIAGSSMGAYIAACWGYGYTGKEMEALARENEGRWQWLRLVDPFIIPRRGFIKGKRVRQRLNAQIKGARFEDLKRPIRVMATKLETFEHVVFSSGDIAQAVHASVAVPGVCAPVEINGETYVDGGIVDPVPVSTLRNMDVDIVIAVKTLPTPAMVRQWIEEGKTGCGKDGERCFRGIKGWLNHHLNYFAYGNILNTMMRSIHAAQMRIAEASCLHADIVLNPVSPDGVWIDFSNPTKYIQLGRAAAEAQLADIQKLVHGTRPQPRNHHHEMRKPGKKLAKVA